MDFLFAVRSFYGASVFRDSVTFSDAKKKKKKLITAAVRENIIETEVDNVSSKITHEFFISEKRRFLP